MTFLAFSLWPRLTFSIQRSVQAHTLIMYCVWNRKWFFTYSWKTCSGNGKKKCIFSFLATSTPNISKMVSFHFHALACSNCIATKCLPSRAWDLIFMKWNETLHRPPSHEVIHFVSQCPRVTVYMFTIRPGLLWTAMAPRTCTYHAWVSHCAQPSCSHLLFPITWAWRRQDSPF